MTKRRRPLVTGARLTGAPVERLVHAAAYLGETHPSVEVRRAMQALRLAESDDARSVMAALPADLADWNAVIAAFRRAGVDDVAIGAAERMNEGGGNVPPPHAKGGNGTWRIRSLPPTRWEA